MTIEEEMFRLPNLKHIGIALVQFVYSLHKETFVKTTTDWIYNPKFVAFGFPKRSETISLHIDVDYPTDIDEKDLRILPLYAGHHYPKCLITEPRQLACATRYVEAAYRRNAFRKRRS
ncbi:MAG TPA: hypothetical protein VE344_04855 [Methylomirabilota bacterium]|nr:hypothetical protein [Methylomirabilota bacterium]